MGKYVISLITVVLFITGGQSAGFAENKACEEHDALCRSFSELADNGQFYRIIAQVSPDRTYSSAARQIIGKAYLMMAGNETNTKEQEEIYCRKAVAFGAPSAYMGLYFLNAGQDVETAILFLKRYVSTGARDFLPYVILGEYELGQGQAASAKDYLLAARKIAQGRPANLDWLLFQANYLLGDYAVASAMLDSAILHGQPLAELKDLMADPRFLGFVTRPEFRKYEPMIKGTSAMAAH